MRFIYFWFDIIIIIHSSTYSKKNIFFPLNFFNSFIFLFSSLSLCCSAYILKFIEFTSCCRLFTLCWINYTWVYSEFHLYLIKNYLLCIVFAILNFFLYKIAYFYFINNFFVISKQSVTPIEHFVFISIYIKRNSSAFNDSFIFEIISLNTLLLIPNLLNLLEILACCLILV